jgi:hypothetical protein
MICTACQHENPVGVELFELVDLEIARARFDALGAGATA